MTARKQKEVEVLSETRFDGLGQGEVRMRVLGFPESLYLEVKRAKDDNKGWLFKMTNAGLEDISIAQENFKTMMWRAGWWFLHSWVNWVNGRLDGKKTVRIGRSEWQRFSIHEVDESPFLDPEPNSPIAVIDRHYSEVTAARRTRPVNLDWDAEPWAAIFLHDAGCLSYLPESDDRYFFMLDLLPGLQKQAGDLPIDRVDFLGALHSVYEPPVRKFDFLKDWSPIFE